MEIWGTITFTWEELDFDCLVSPPGFMLFRMCNNIDFTHEGNMNNTCILLQLYIESGFYDESRKENARTF